MAPNGGRPSSLNVTGMLEALGVKGGAQFALGDGPLTPVVLAADVSRSFTAEAVEARCVTTISIEGNGPEVPVLEIFVRPAGGIVIEDFAAETTVLGDGGPRSAAFPEASHVIWLARPIAALGPDPVNPILRLGGFVGTQSHVGMPVGGVECLTEFRSHRRNGIASSAHGAFPPNYRAQPNVRWWLPPGTQLALQHNSQEGVGVPPLATYSLTIREVHHGLGAP